MARVTDAEVGEILDTTETVFTPFIAAANVMVTNTLVTTGKVTDTDLLKEIERWLAAHFYKIKDPHIQQAKVGDASEMYNVTLGVMKTGLYMTRYGRQVMVLDTSGALASIGKGTSNITTLEMSLT